jgi:membrane associated rhomboid family serine protease
MWAEIQQHWREGGVLNRLILLNLAVFVGVATVRLLGRMEMLPGEEAWWTGPGVFGLAVSWDLAVLQARPWAVLTHMFVHTDVWHVALNMLLLWWMGRVFAASSGNRRLLSTYLLGGLAGFLVYAVMSNLFPGLRSGSTFAYGASAAVMAVFAAAATREPDRPVGIIFLGQVPLKWVALAYVALDYFGLSSGGAQTGGHLAHLGGAVYGFLLVRAWNRGYDPARWFEVLLDRLAVWAPRGGAGGTRMKMVQRRRKAEPIRRTVSDEDFNASKKEKAERLDHILDKISRQGYDSLSVEEKRFLFEQSHR